MAIQAVNLNDSLSNLKTLLLSYVREDPDDITEGMFSSVEDVESTISGTDYVGIRCNVLYGGSEVPCLDIYRLNDKTLYLVVYYNGTTSVAYSIKQVNNISTATPANVLAYAYSCEHGVLIYFQLTNVIATQAAYFTTIMVTKGSDGYPFIVTAASTAMGTGDTGPVQPRIHHIADSLYLDATFTGTVASTDNVVAMQPVLGYGPAIGVAYASHAYFISMATPAVRNAGPSAMRFNSEFDGITNGYWAILDNDLGEEAGT